MAGTGRTEMLEGTGKILEWLNVFRHLANLFHWLTSKLGYCDWGRIHALLGRIDSKLRMSNFNPDVYVAVAREGAIVASYYCFNWRRKPLCALDREFLKREGEVHIRLYNSIDSSFIQGKKVLLIDCEVNTGASMKEAKRWLLEKGAVEVRTCALGVSQTAPIELDYEGFSFSTRPKWPWVRTREAREARRGHYQD